MREEGITGSDSTENGLFAGEDDGLAGGGVDVYEKVGLHIFGVDRVIGG